MDEKKREILASLFPWKYKKRRLYNDSSIVERCVWQIVLLSVAIGVGISIGFWILKLGSYLKYVWIGVLTSILHFLLLKWSVDSLVSAVLSKGRYLNLSVLGGFLGYIMRMIVVGFILGIVGWFHGVGAFLSSVLGIFSVRIAIFIYGLFV